MRRAVYHDTASPIPPLIVLRLALCPLSSACWLGRAALRRLRRLFAPLPVTLLSASLAALPLRGILFFWGGGPGGVMDEVRDT